MNERDRSAAPYRIAQVITRLNIGGPARHVLDVSREFSSGPFRTALYYGTEGPHEGIIEPTGLELASRVPRLQRKVSAVDDVASYRELKATFRSYRPHIVHTHLAKAGLTARLAAFRSKVPIVIHTFHGHVLEGYFSPPVASVIRRVESVLARRTDRLVAVSPEIRDELLAWGLGRPDQWRVVPLGMELDPFLGSPLSRTEARRRLGLDAVGPLVGIVGRIVPIKDHPTFIRAAVEIAGSHPDVRFVVAGDGESRSVAEDLARSALPGRFDFLGWVADLPTLYAALDVVVLTSQNEGTPLALIEAGAAGVPVVATDVGGVRHVVREGVTGFLVEKGRPNQVAAAVLRLLSDPDLAARFGTEGRRWIQSRFSSRPMFEGLRSIYVELLRTKLGASLKAESGPFA